MGRRVDSTYITAFATAILGMTAAPGAARATTARGVVFEDRDADGRKDDDEPGISGVAVSDGERVVTTDDQGRYVLRIEDDTIIFVSTPATHRAPTDRFGRRQFHYIHKPKGSPDSYFPGVKPTGKLPKRVDFPLRPAPEDTTFRAVLFADPQPETARELAHVARDAVEPLAGAEADFAVVLGDLMFDDLSLFEPYVEIFGHLQMPVHHVIGNHDLNFDAKDDRTSDETYERLFGPPYYSFDRGSAHLVVLDTVLWQGPGEGTGHYEDGLDARQLRWLENDLARVPDERLVVLMMHIPLATRRGVAEGFDRLAGLLADRKEVLALAGHTHYTDQIELGSEQGWTAEGRFTERICGTVSGAWWSGDLDLRGVPEALQYDGTPNGWTWLDVDAAGWRLTFQAAGQPVDVQMRVDVPGRHDPDPRVLANVWYGTPAWTVEASVDGGAFAPLVQTPGEDPLAVQRYEGPGDVGKPWVDAIETPHLWSGPLPELKAGIHRVTVRAEDPWGRRYTTTRIFMR